MTRGVSWSAGPGTAPSDGTGLKAHQSRGWDKRPWMSVSAGSKGPRRTGHPELAHGQRDGFPVQPDLAVGSRLAARLSTAAGHILPSRSPCRLSLCLSARPHLEAAWTARGGRGTPGGRGLCRTHGRQTSTLQKRGGAVRLAPHSRGVSRGTRGAPRRDSSHRHSGTRVSINFSAHSLALAQGRHTTRRREMLVMTDPEEQATRRCFSRRLGSEIL